MAALGAARCLRAAGPLLTPRGAPCGRCPAGDVGSGRVQPSRPVEASSSTKTVRSATPGKLRMKGLTLSVGTSIIPHPEKAATGGEDALFVSTSSGGAIGVADGVGGWRDSGIDPAEYSRLFMRTVQNFLENNKAELPASQDGAGSRKLWPGIPDDRQEQGIPSLRDALAVAHASVRLPGSTTACVLRLDKATESIEAINLGDSGFLLARDGAVHLQSVSMQHYFDCPRQFAACPEYVEATDSAADADEYTWEAQPGDVIIMGTDGLWDNCYGEELLKLLPQCPEDAQEAADQIASLAQRHSMDPKHESPYVVEARTQGMDLEWYEKLLGTRIEDGRIVCGRLLGGKVDDITVVAAYVMDAKR